VLDALEVILVGKGVHAPTLQEELPSNTVDVSGNRHLHNKGPINGELYVLLGLHGGIQDLAILMQLLKEPATKKKSVPGLLEGLEQCKGHLHGCFVLWQAPLLKPHLGQVVARGDALDVGRPTKMELLAMWVGKSVAEVDGRDGNER
jgi:hypothetical protein